MHTDMSHATQLTELTTRAALEAMEPEWSALWQRCPGSTPFQSPQWLIPWSRALGEEMGRVWVVTLREGGRLAAVLPLFRRERRFALMGEGVSDYLDMLAEPQFGPVAARMSMVYLCGAAERWESCEFRQLPHGSPLASTPCPSARVRCETRADACCPVLDISDEDWSRRIPASQLQKLRYYWRRAQREGELRVELAHPGTLDRALDTMMSLHAARWAEAGRPGVLNDPAVQAFHRDSSRALLEAGLLRLYTLSLGGRAAASLYALHAHRRAFYYISGFDPHFREISPGLLIVGHAIETAAAEGCETFDFLRGREPYKYAWGAADSPTFRRLLTTAPEPVP